MFDVFPVQKTVSVTVQSDPGNLTVRLFSLEFAGELVGFSENITKIRCNKATRHTTEHTVRKKNFLQSEAITTFCKGRPQM